MPLFLLSLRRVLLLSCQRTSRPAAPRGAAAASLLLVTRHSAVSARPARHRPHALGSCDASGRRLLRRDRGRSTPRRLALSVPSPALTRSSFVTLSSPAGVGPRAVPAGGAAIVRAPPPGSEGQRTVSRHSCVTRVGLAFVLRHNPGGPRPNTRLASTATAAFSRVSVVPAADVQLGPRARRSCDSGWGFYSGELRRAARDIEINDTNSYSILVDLWGYF